MKLSQMKLYSTEVIPIDSLLRGERTDSREIWAGAKEKPAHFALELFSLVMMAVGAVVFVGWAYRVGFQVGSSLL